MTIRATATKSGNTADATFDFELVDICDPPISIKAPTTIEDFEFNIRNNNRPSYSFDDFEPTPILCSYFVTYTETKLVNSDADTVIFSFNDD